MECSKCGVSGSKTRLFDAISEKGIVHLCKDCSIKEDIPVIKKPTTEQLKESEKKEGFRESIKRFERRPQISPEQKRQIESQEITLRSIVEKNFSEKDLQKELKPRTDLIENFHWIIMRARRARKMTVPQLAKEIAESESVIKMAERGLLPEDDYKIVNKLETYLGIRIIKPEVEEQLKNKPRRIGFDKVETKIITIEDLNNITEEIKEKKEPYWKRFMFKKKKQEIQQEEIENSEEDYSEEFVQNPESKIEETKESRPEFIPKKVPEKNDKRELTQTEIDDLIFGRR